MALIQIRDVPEATYESIRRRARRAGQSIQAYMLARTIEFGDQPTIDEVIAQIEQAVAEHGPLAVDSDALGDDIRAGR